MKFIFTCGGTAGHINPALAVAQYLKDNIPSSEFLFIGAKGNMEMDLIPREGYEIKGLTITNISRELSLRGFAHNAETLKNVAVSCREAKKIISDFAPDAVAGTGGYVCYPVLKAAASLGIPALIHESNAGPGLTTRMLSGCVDRILLGVPGCESEYADPSKLIVTGTPARADFSMHTKENARAEMGITGSEPLVLSVWGSLGSGYMNETMLKMIPLLREGSGFRLIHVTGKKYYESFISRLKDSCPDYAEHGVEIFPYIYDISRVMSAAELVICRAGASTLSELCCMGKPSILVPSPNVTGNHQMKNASVLKNRGAAELLEEGSFNELSLLGKIKELLTEENLLSEMSAAARTLAGDDAAEKIAGIILELAGGRS